MTPAEAGLPLTAREREVAGLVAQGLRSREIAERLYVSVGTVSSHLRSAYIKTGTGSRVKLVVWLLENGDATAAAQSPEAL